DFMADLSERKRSEWSKFSGLENNRVARRQRRRDLPRQHQQWKVPGNDLTDHTASRVIRKVLRQQLCPACMIVKVSCDQRDIHVAALTDRLAVVHRLQHG